MATIDPRYFKVYQDGRDRLSAADYMAERETFRLAINDLEAKLERAGLDEIEGITANLASLNEAINQSIAESSTLNEQTTEQLGEVISTIEDIRQNGTGVDTQARQGVQTVTAALADTGTQLSSLETANAKDELSLINYLGNKQNIHPKVLQFPESWNGFKYWMAYTPYPNGDTTAENPCVAVSNDKFSWTVPNGLVNPLDPAPPTGYNSDTHLVYRSDTNTIEIWWRHAEESTSTATIYRRTSTDGVNWTAREVLFALNPMSSKDMLSPAVIFEDGKYKIWSCHKGKVKYCESTDSAGRSWTPNTELAIDWGTLSAWHLDVIKTELGYEMIICAYEPGGNNNSSDLYYLIQNGNSFTKPKPIIRRSKNKTSIDYTSIYRSCILKEGSEYYIFYSSIAADGKRHMAISYGRNILGLNGFVNLNREASSNVVRIPGGTTLTDYDVSNIDMIMVNGTSPVTINSLKGGYEGKKIAILVEGLNASAKLVYGAGNRILLPGLKDYTLNVTQLGMFLICTNVAGTTFRAIADPGVRDTTYTRLTDGTTPYVDYDVSNWDTVAFQSIGGVPFTVESFTGGHVGKKLDILVIGSNTKVTFKNGTRIATPNGVDYVLDPTKGGVRLICTSLGVYRLIV